MDEELEILSSIYEDNEFKARCESKGEAGMFLRLEVTFDETVRIGISLMVPPDYPMSCPVPVQDNSTDVEFLKGIIDSAWSKGCECLFQIIEHMREERTEEKETVTVEEADLQFVDPEVAMKSSEQQYKNCEPASVFDVDHHEDGLIIHQGPIVEVNKSKFQCFTSVVANLEEVSAFQRAVVSTKACAKATHNMFAYRFYDGSIAHHDYDDDGETGAASKLAEMIRTMNLVDADKGIGGEPGRGLAVIVSRWYGGGHLGPARFRIICNTARDELERLGFLDKDKERSTSKASRKKAK